VRLPPPVLQGPFQSTSHESANIYAKWHSSAASPQQDAPKDDEAPQHKARRVLQRILGAQRGTGWGLQGIRQYSIAQCSVLQDSAVHYCTEGERYQPRDVAVRLLLTLA
jgi:hypothetical protein